jgi:hypothetical protein
MTAFFSRLRLHLAALFTLFASLLTTGAAYAQEPEIWEYSPYKVKVWLSISPTLSLSPKTEAELHRRIAEYAELNFGPTWNVSVEATPDALFGSVLYRLDELTVDQLLSRELILMIGKTEEAKKAYLKVNPPPPKPPVDPKNPPKKLSKAEQETLADLEAKAASLQSIRTLESATEKLKSIAIHPLQYSGLQRDILPYMDKKLWVDFKAIVKPFTVSSDELVRQMGNGETLAAFVQRIDVPKFKNVARQLPTRLPWQPESLLRNNDKIFMASVDRVDGKIQIQVKELDSFVRRMSEISKAEVVYASDIPRAVAALTLETFSPMVRIEENDFKTAVLRVKAAGLVTTEEHPIRIGPGDVILPVIRRDDSNGNPTVLQPIPYTFLAVTEKIDNTSRLFSAIFTASRGSLANAKNRRTQRVGLKLQPHHQQSMLSLGIQRTPGSSVPGTEIYLRTPGDTDLKMVGRTDWRGMLPLTVRDLPTIQYDPPGESKVAAIANARQISIDPVPPPEYKVVEDESDAPVSIAPVDLSAITKEEKPKSGEPAETEKANAAETPAADGTTPPAATPAEEKKPEAPPAPPPPPKTRGFIQIKVPLYLYYVKNGETLLARLPIVTGNNTVDRADLPDDRRRLETEAFLKGVQGDVLDLVIRRKILESRIKIALQKKDVTKAEELLDELKRVKTFDKMSDQIESIQRRALAKDRGPLLTGVVKRIDKMLDTTRDLVQRYLQDKIVRDMETLISKSK